MNFPLTVHVSAYIYYYILSERGCLVNLDGTWTRDLYSKQVEINHLIKPDYITSKDFENNLNIMNYQIYYGTRIERAKCSYVH